MAAAIHSAKHLFSILQHVLVDQRGPRLRLNALVRRALHDWIEVAQALANHPIPLSSLVPMAPTSIGASAAPKAGMGGFWLPTEWNPSPHPPLAWRAPFLPTIQRHLVCLWFFFMKNHVPLCNLCAMHEFFFF